MDSEPPTPDRTLSRRALLAGAATGLTLTTSGCIREIRSIISRDPDDHLSLTIATVPDDGDPQSTRLAHRLRDALEIAGIDSEISPLATEELHRKVLINHDFDCFVTQLPDVIDPDFLFGALHSSFADEWGWQNPFGFTNMSFDDLLVTQRESDGDDRRDAIVDVLESVTDEQPFVPLCAPDEYRLYRGDRFEGWGTFHPADRLAYLALEPVEDDTDELRGVITDGRATENLNPLSAEYRNRGTIVSLLYDSLAVFDGDDFVPWLAESWEWDDESVTVELRRTDWHDGEPLTADDVAFTYRFLQDTALEDDVRAPPPLYRSHATAIDEVVVEDDHTIRIVPTAGREVTEYAFTAPILPEHVWIERTDQEDFPGVDVAVGTTTAVVTDNIEPIGSGPFAFVDRTERERIELERFEDHFSIAADGLPAASVETFRIDVEPRDGSAIEAIETDSADIMISMLDAVSIDDIEQTDAVRLLESPSRTLYCVGFNTRSAPISNPYFRQTVASLLDKERVVEEVFEGYAEPTATPLTGEWVPEHLEWDGTDPAVPFIGIDGELSERQARRAFEAIGYRYDSEGNFLVRG